MGGFWRKYLHASLGVAAAGRGGARGSSGKAKGPGRQAPRNPRLLRAFPAMESRRSAFLTERLAPVT